MIHYTYILLDNDRQSFQARGFRFVYLDISQIIPGLMQFHTDTFP